jgi:hypothetical protein
VFASGSFIFLSNFLRLKFIFQNRNEKGLTLQLSQQMVQTKLLKVVLKCQALVACFGQRKEFCIQNLITFCNVFFWKSPSYTFSEILSCRILELLSDIGVLWPQLTKSSRKGM